MDLVEQQTTTPDLTPRSTCSTSPSQQLQHRLPQPANQPDQFNGFLFHHSVFDHSDHEHFNRFYGLVATPFVMYSNGRIQYDETNKRMGGPKAVKLKPPAR